MRIKSKLEFLKTKRHKAQDKEQNTQKITAITRRTQPQQTRSKRDRMIRKWSFSKPNETKHKKKNKTHKR